jgi:general stress protein YciG
MAGTKAGGLKAAKTNKKKYGEEFYKGIGSKGGKAKVPKGFATNRELARLSGSIGGKISRRKGVKNISKVALDE